MNMNKKFSKQIKASKDRMLPSPAAKGAVKVKPTVSKKISTRFHNVVLKL